MAATLKAALKPIKLNYEVHGNTIPHLHVNLYPGFIGDRFDGAPIDARVKIQRSAAEIMRLRSILNQLRDESG